MDDMELVFYNCRLYNGIESEVGQIGTSLQEEYLRLVDQLYFNFYTSQAEWGVPFQIFLLLTDILKLISL